MRMERKRRGEKEEEEGGGIVRHFIISIFISIIKSSIKDNTHTYAPLSSRHGLVQNLKDKNTMTCTVSA